MTQVGSTNTSWGEGGVNDWRVWRYIAPATGTVALSAYSQFSDSTANSVHGLAIAFSNVNQTTPNRTLVQAVSSTSTPNVSCSDAVAGDTVVSWIMDRNNVPRYNIVSSRGTAQTQRVYAGYDGWGAADQVGYLDTGIATSTTEQHSWVLTSAFNHIRAIIPIVAV